jgi:MFS family permease
MRESAREPWGEPAGGFPRKRVSGRLDAVKHPGEDAPERAAVGKLESQLVLTRLRPLYATGFIHSLVLWYSVEKLFMRSIGLNDYLITIATLAYIAVMMTANIPLGILADRWSRKGVLYVATWALIASSLVGGLSHGLASYTAGISAWGLFYAAYAGTYDSVVYDVVVEETGSVDNFERCYGRLQMFESAAFIASALLSVVVARFASLRLEYFLTVPLTCCAFATLRRFREPSLHRRASGARLRAHVGQILQGATRADVAWIVVALVANCVVMRLMIEFYQLWYLGLALPVVWYGPSCALMYCGAWSGGALADKLRGRRTLPAAGFGTLAIAGGLFVRVPAIVVGAQMATIVGITVLNIGLTRYLHDAMPSSIRAGAASVVSTVGYGAFVPAALGFGLFSRAHGIFDAAAFVVAPLGVTCFSVVCVRHRIRRLGQPAPATGTCSGSPGPGQESASCPASAAAGRVRAHARP